MRDTLYTSPTYRIDFPSYLSPKGMHETGRLVKAVVKKDGQLLERILEDGTVLDIDGNVIEGSAKNGKAKKGEDSPQRSFPPYIYHGPYRMAESLQTDIFNRNKARDQGNKLTEKWLNKKIAFKDETLSRVEREKGTARTRRLLGRAAVLFSTKTTQEEARKHRGGSEEPAQPEHGPAPVNRSENGNKPAGTNDSAETPKTKGEQIQDTLNGLKEGMAGLGVAFAAQELVISEAEAEKGRRLSVDEQNELTRDHELMSSAQETIRRIIGEAEAKKGGQLTGVETKQAIKDYKEDRAIEKMAARLEKPVDKLTGDERAEAIRKSRRRNKATASAP